MNSMVIFKNWHYLYLPVYTCVLGFVACWATSKRLEIGSADRSWSDVKQLTDWKRSNLGKSSLEKSAILSTLAKLRESHIRNQEKIEGSDYFGDDDIKWVCFSTIFVKNDTKFQYFLFRYDLDLENWGSDADELKIGLRIGRKRSGK